MNDLKPCPHAHRCVHPCDQDECFLETIEQPNGPLIPLTKAQCDEFERIWSIDRVPDEDLIAIATTGSNRAVALSAEIALRKRYPSKRAASRIKPPTRTPQADKEEK